MPTFQERCGKWRAQIRVRKARESATFETLESAKEWARTRAKEIRASVRPGLPTRVATLVAGARHAEADIVAASIPARAACGIYFLIKDKKVVYVGKSTDLFSRISDHKRKTGFDSFSFLPCERGDLDRLEMAYILALMPKYNRLMMLPAAV